MNKLSEDDLSEIRDLNNKKNIYKTLVLFGKEKYLENLIETQKKYEDFFIKSSNKYQVYGKIFIDFDTGTIKGEKK